MQLQRLTGLERQKILDELAELLKTIERLRAILASERLLMQIIVDELKEVRTKYGDDRRTEIIEGESGEISIEDLITEEDMIFSDRGRAYWLKVHEIPDVGPGGKGKSIANLVSMEAGERIAAMVAVKEFEEDKFVVMGTRRGAVKKTALSAYSNPRAGGIIAMGVEDGDAVIAVQVSDGSGEIFIGTRNGMKCL